jgi:hypothetical protein
LKRKKGQKFSKDRDEGSINQNFVQMYNKVYYAMEQAGTAEKLEQSIWVNKDQQPTNKESSFGRICPF